MKKLLLVSLVFILVSCGTPAETPVNEVGYAIPLEAEEVNIKDTTKLSDIERSTQGTTEASEVNKVTEATVDVSIDQFADWSGEYYTKDNKLLELLGPSETGGVDMDITYDDIECIGFWALAQLEKSGVANFYDTGSKCQINLTYNPGVVELHSYDCSAYESTKCGGFSGTYTLK